MSKRSRAIEKARRRSEKFKRKLQKKDLYAKFAESGKHKGSRRATKKKRTVNVFAKPNRNRRTTKDVEITGQDGQKCTVQRGGTYTPSRRRAEQIFGTQRTCARRNA